MQKYKEGVASTVLVDQAMKVYMRNGDFGMLPYAAPMKAKDLSGLPPAYVEALEYDSIADQAIAYGERLKKSGVPTEVMFVKGAYHGYDYERNIPLVQRMLKHRCDVMKRMFADEGNSR